MCCPAGRLPGDCCVRWGMVQVTKTGCLADGDRAATQSRLWVAVTAALLCLGVLIAQQQLGRPFFRHITALAAIGELLAQHLPPPPFACNRIDLQPEYVNGNRTLNPSGAPCLLHNVSLPANSLFCQAFILKGKAVCLLHHIPGLCQTLMCVEAAATLFT